MLDIISMVILLFLFFGFAISLLFILILIGNSKNKTEEEQLLEDQEQMEYLRNYQKNKEDKKK